MSTYFKPVLVLIISILIFAGFYYLADKELVDIVQTRFYNPSVLNSYMKENSKDAELVQSLLFELQNKFAETLNEPAVQSSFLYNQSPNDIYERSRIFGMLLESTAGLQSVQFVDSNGIRLHYSTSTNDIMSQSANSTAYRNYTDDPMALPYDRVSVSANNSAKFSMDELGDRIIFSFPFNDSMDVYRGTALYSVSVRALADKLVAEGRLKVNENVFVTGIPPGIVLGIPYTSKIDILNKVSSIWNDGVQDRVTFDSGDSGMKFSLISLRTGRGIYFGRLVNDSLFYISDSMKNILLLSMFLTFYLTLLFIVNFKSNPATIVRNRIKRLRESLFEQLYVNKTGHERAKWILELEQRRDEIRLELKHNLRLGKRAEKNIDDIIDKSWDELLAVIKAGGETRVITVTEREQAQVEAKGAGHQPSLQGEGSSLEAVEEIEEIEEIVEVEEAGGDDETIEEFEEIGDAQEIGEAEEEELEEILDIEEIEEEPAPVHVSRGLLMLASKIFEMEKAKVDVSEELDELDELEEFEEIEAPQPRKGLLSLADSKYSSDDEEPEESPSLSGRGLLALASDIEFSHEYPVGDIEENGEDLDTELDIVSPFASMFESLSASED